MMANDQSNGIASSTSSGMCISNTQYPQAASIISAGDMTGSEEE